MSRVPSGTELVRPFLLARDFELTRRFYEVLGFEKVLDSDVTIFRASSGEFILLPADLEGMTVDFMMQLMVDDLDVWWARIGGLDLMRRFNVPAPQPPALQPYGLRVAFLVDPSGVLWHVTERRAGAVSD